MDLLDRLLDNTMGSVGACPMKRTIDEKAQEDGLAVESVVVGVACDHLVVLGCGENNGMCLLYDFTDINNPTLLKTFNLSPVSESMNPEQTYRKTLGDLDAETTLFLSPEHSPTGNSGFLFGGAISGTLSFWEFQCQTPEQRSNNLNTSDGDSGLSGGAIAGIIIGAVVGVILIGFIVIKMSGGKSDAKTTTAHGDGSDGMA
eukprot:scaffold337_cov172-Amphora_coffeaeformis.AAC.16